MSLGTFYYGFSCIVLVMYLAKCTMDRFLLWLECTSQIHSKAEKHSLSEHAITFCWRASLRLVPMAKKFALECTLGIEGILKSN